ncbi:hypothetical protein ACRWQL_00910 (plasmid) [Shewanella sp. HL-SH4]|uniref:hypothetical protein n=1 Tax=Shewanella TaxID=22 RepID=UPI003D79FF6B
MEHVSDSKVNKAINRFIRNECKKYDLAKIIKIIMQQSFSNLTLSKLDKHSIVHGHQSAIIDEVSKAAVFELFDREVTTFDKKLINDSWKHIYDNGLAKIHSTHH